MFRVILRQLPKDLKEAYMKKLLCFISAIAVIFWFGRSYADYLTKDIFVSNAWVQAIPPSQTTTAAYMVIANNSPKEVVLISASSDIAGSAEIHQMSDMNGMMNMAQLANIHIPALGKVRLQPGGFHIMLINLKKPANKGDNIPIALHFQGGSTIIVDVPVKMQEANDSSNMMGMKM